MDSINLRLKSIYFLLILSIIFGLNACSYSFTGSSVPPHLKSIAVPTVNDRSNSGIPSLSTYLTNQLINNFIDDNSLQIAKKGYSDALLECTITSYSNKIAAVTNNSNTGNQRQISISVKVVYTDLIKRKKIFERTFSDKRNYSTSASNQITLIDEKANEILKKISEDILLAVISNW